MPLNSNAPDDVTYEAPTQEVGAQLTSMTTMGFSLPVGNSSATLTGIAASEPADLMGREDQRYSRNAILARLREKRDYHQSRLDMVTRAIEALNASTNVEVYRSIDEGLHG